MGAAKHRAFESLAAEARQVIVHAESEARELGHDHLGTEHLLLGLLRMREGLPTSALEAPELTIEKVRDCIERLARTGDASGTQELPLTPMAGRVLDHARVAAGRSPRGEVSAAQLASSLLHFETGVAARALVMLGVDVERLREQTAAHAGNEQSRVPEEDPPPPPVEPPEGVLAGRMDFVIDGGLVLVGRGTAEAALLSLSTLRALTDATELRVEVYRNRRPEAYTVVLPELLLEHFDWDLDAALIGLAMRIRSAIEPGAGQEQWSSAQRAVATRLWLEDAMGRLGRALQEAALLMDAEYDDA
jgi:ATP-dependent Clp protease ATP-binding subunit ClpC